MSEFTDKLFDLTQSVSEKINNSSGRSVKEVYVNGAERARKYAEITKKTIEQNRDYDDLNKVFAEIGKIYYDENRSDPKGFYSALFSQIAEIQLRIAERDEEIVKIKESIEK